MLDLREFFPPELLTLDALPLVIARIRATPMQEGSKRYLLGEWARQLGIKLPSYRYDELRSGAQLPTVLG